ncbi:macrophage mannose receptor 1-like [Amphibalanus amphitrite]|uniref:macrophage mannose receptor 1-like n=1 Tax=Amphibalanus amphitrite TaxID=1232801 RepID=UPI001C915F1D|nr:macrophage mannose receptor 1-like [Amphibalanus amphitrite]
MLVCVQLAIPSSASLLSDSACPDGWVGPHRSVCYRLSDEYLDWNEANASGCQELQEGAYLASVTYANKAFLSKQESITDSDYYWVGLRSGDAEWNSGTAAAEPVDFTNWGVVRHQEPSGSSVTNDDCVLLIGEVPNDEEYGASGTWMDWDCGLEAFFLCELKKDPGVACPNKNWIRHNDACYMLHDIQNKTFAEAEERCDQLQPGATLGSVADYDALVRIVPGMDTAAYYWIGLRSTPAPDGRLRWRTADAAEVLSTHWWYAEYDEPNGARMGPDHDCVRVSGRRSAELYTTGEWEDQHCGHRSRFLCALRV